MRQVEPGGALVVEVGEGALVEIGCRQTGRVEPGVALRNQLLSKATAGCWRKTCG
jgi:hypothetical protein